VKIKKICVLGLGYIGLPTASTFAAHGLQVDGVDVNPRVLASLREGKLHIHEPGLGEMVKAALQDGNLHVREKPEEADAFIIAVPTPFFEDRFGEYNGHRYKLADMRAVTSAAEAIVPVLRRGNLVVLESTSPPRTTLDLLVPILEKSALKAGKDFFLAYSPERVLPGQILRELVENARVIGGITPESASAGRDLYAAFVQGEIIETDATTAEMVKLMENTYRDVNIAIANEFSRLAAQFGVDVWEAVRIANLHPRVKILSPGPGVGGHCISVDPWFLVEAAPDLARLIYTARRVNDDQPQVVIRLARTALGSLKDKRIAVLGLSYKPEVDDLRESPAVEVIHLLQSEGAIVKAFEPFKPDADLKNVTALPTLESAVAGSEAVFLLVNHRMLQEVTPSRLASLTSARILLDCVNGWAGEEWQSAGFKIYRLGVQA
jgi:UDP-N-acetyl-D-mannosaminuronic acid dehydrogenase